MPILRTPESNRREQIIQSLLNKSGIFSFVEYQGGTFAALDWWIYKDGQLVGVAEFKGRTCPSTKYPTIFLAARKYKALVTESQKYNIIPLIIYGFADGKVKGMDVREVRSEWQSTVFREKRRASGHVGSNDTESAYELPVKHLREFGTITGETLAEYNRLGVGL